MLGNVTQRDKVFLIHTRLRFKHNPIIIKEKKIQKKKVENKTQREGSEWNNVKEIKFTIVTSAAEIGRIKIQ